MSSLDELAYRVGILPEYHRIDGSLQVCEQATKIALLQAMGLEARSDEEARQSLERLDASERSGDLPRSIVVAVGEESRVQLGHWRLLLEDGRYLQSDPADPSLIPALPDGVHVLDHASGRILVISAPHRAPTVTDAVHGGRAWGVMLPLYGLRSGRNAGIGNYEDLACAAEALSAHGADFVGINPVHARGIAEDGRSPYSPSSRSAFETDHIALDSACEAGLSVPRDTELVDYDAARGVQRPLLRASFERFDSAPVEQRNTFESWLAARSNEETLQSVYEAISAMHGPDWRLWPEKLRDPDGSEVDAYRNLHGKDVRFYEWCQWLAAEQLHAAQTRAKAAGMAFGLYLDIAVGVRPGGADTWADGSAFARGVSLGAPPDLLNSEGQNWDLAPFSPLGLRTRHFEPFRRMLRATMAHAGIVRIDHVIGFARSFWVPEDGVAGGYVSFPLEELLALTRIEACRAGCVVVGEDLGTVPDGLREALAASGLYGCTILPFEKEWIRIRHPREHRPMTMASFGSHDLPSIAGWWRAADIDTRDRLGHPIGPREREDRAYDRQSLWRMLIDEDLLPAGADGDDPPQEANEDIVDAVHRLLARGNSHLASLSLDDIFTIGTQQNVPGTVDEEPNWRRRSPVDVEDLEAAPELGRASEAMREIAPHASSAESGQLRDE